MNAALVSALAGVFSSQPARRAVQPLFDCAHWLLAAALHTHAMANVYGYGASQQIPNKDKSFSLGAASLHPRPFLQLVCVTLGRLIANCYVLASTGRRCDVQRDWLLCLLGI